jgi:NAD(P)-dependent dehydrogenase (short-subunit alcohol dehydrogenase family)
METRQERKNGRRDPRDQGPKPPFPEQGREASGEQGRMSPEPDCGEQSYRGHDRLKGKVALITGGDSGIGRAVAIAFAREGADVAIGYLENDQDAAESGRWVKEAGRKVALLKGDIADDQVCSRFVAQTVAELGRLDILVNNAAYQAPSAKTIEEIDAARVTRTLLTNIGGLFSLTRHAVPHLAPGSVIINSASIQAYQPTPGILDYASTKGAIVTFTKGLGLELIKRGIRVNAIAPGPVWTPLVAKSLETEELQTFGEANPMGRPAQPAELAPPFVFLASDESRFVNAEVIGVTGGMLLG